MWQQIGFSCTLSTLFTARITGALPSRSLLSTISSSGVQRVPSTTKNHQLNIANGAARRFVHQTVNGAFFFHMQAWGINVDRLIRAFSMDPHNAVTSCLRLAGGNGDLLPQQFVQQCGFANVRTSDDSNKSAVTLSMLIPAPVFSTPVRRQPAQPYDGLNLCQPPVHSGR